MTKELKEKAVSIKGKDYVLVKDRILYFNETYPNGSIETIRESEWDMEVVKAIVCPDCDKPWRVFTGYSQAKWGEWLVNKMAALENAETSAVWRALAMMWIGVIDSIASADEMNKAGANWKDKFSESIFKKFEERKDKYKDWDEAIMILSKSYIMDQVWEAKVRSLYPTA